MDKWNKEHLLQCLTHKYSGGGNCYYYFPVMMEWPLSQVPLTLDFLNCVYWPCKRLFHRLLHSNLFPLLRFPSHFLCLPSSVGASSWRLLVTFGHYFFPLYSPRVLFYFILYFSILIFPPTISVAVWEDCNLRLFWKLKVEGLLCQLLYFPD